MTRTGLRFFSLMLVAWTLCFVVLRLLGTWIPFACVGLVSAAIALSTEVVPRSMLRPSLARAAVGVTGGALMVIGTHLVYRAVVAFAPAAALATRQLLFLLDIAGFSPVVRALLVALIASCEEVLFRGLLPASATAKPIRPHWPTWRQLAQILAFSSVYALTTLPLGSTLLLLCALTCGTLWGLMRVATGSLVVPILAHVVWDLGVLLVWPPR